MPAIAKSLAEQRQISARTKDLRIKAVTPGDIQRDSEREMDHRHCSSKQTLKVRTQRGVQSAVLPLSRRYRTDRMYNEKKLRAGQKFNSTDTLFGRLTTRALKYMQMSPILWRPTRWRRSHHTPGRRCDNLFVTPEMLTSDGAAEQTGRIHQERTQTRYWSSYQRIFETSTEQSGISNQRSKEEMVHADDKA